MGKGKEEKKGGMLHSHMRDQARNVKLRVHPPTSDRISQVLGEACPEAFNEVVHSAETGRVSGVDPFRSLCARAGVCPEWPRRGVADCGGRLER